MKKLISLTTLTVLVASSLSLIAVKPAAANDDAKINARIAAWGRNCKNEVASRLGTDVSMADIDVTLSETTRASIDAGEITLSDINKHGLIYNWSVPNKKVAGYCGTDGKGKVNDFQFN